MVCKKCLKKKKRQNLIVPYVFHNFVCLVFYLVFFFRTKHRKGVKIKKVANTSKDVGQVVNPNMALVHNHKLRKHKGGLLPKCRICKTKLFKPGFNFWYQHFLEVFSYTSCHFEQFHLKSAVRIQPWKEKLHEFLIFWEARKRLSFPKTQRNFDNQSAFLTFFSCKTSINFNKKPTWVLKKSSCILRLRSVFKF